MTYIHAFMRTYKQIHVHTGKCSGENVQRREFSGDRFPEGNFRNFRGWGENSRRGNFLDPHLSDYGECLQVIEEGVIFRMLCMYSLHSIVQHAYMHICNRSAVGAVRRPRRAAPPPTICGRRRRLLLIGAPPPPIICWRAADAVVAVYFLLQFSMTIKGHKKILRIERIFREYLKKKFLATNAAADFLGPTKIDRCAAADTMTSVHGSRPN